MCLQYNSMTKSSNDFIPTTEGASDEPRLVNACNISFGTVTKTSSVAFLNNQELSLFDHIHFGHENQRVLYKYLDSNFHVSCLSFIHAQLS